MPERIAYAPPPLNRGMLARLTLEAYPSHHGSQTSKEQIVLLVAEYLKVWHLKLEFPLARIVAPAPVIAVARIHCEQKEYFNECMDYFNRYVHPSDITWEGESDPLAVVHTVGAYHERYHFAPPEVVWNELLKLHTLRKAHLRLVS